MNRLSAPQPQETSDLDSSPTDVERTDGIGLAVAMVMVRNLLVIALVGAGIPLLLLRLGIYPAVSQAVLVTTFTEPMCSSC